MEYRVHQALPCCKSLHGVERLMISACMGLKSTFLLGETALVQLLKPDCQMP